MTFFSRLLFLFSLFSLTPLLGRDPLDRPNFVVIFLDDCGYGDFSHTGNPTIHTPNVSKMVSQGLNFPQFYAASPACTASRYSLLTGRNPARSGLNAWVLGPNSKRYIHPKEVTLAEGLKDHGYRTGFFGKWHLGNPNKDNEWTPNSFPLAHGFEVWEGTNVSNDFSKGADYVRSNPNGNTPIPGYELVAQEIPLLIPLQEQLTQNYRQRSISFIKEHKNEPFLLYLAPNMPHLPVHASKNFKGKSKRGLYGDCIEEIDAMVGDLLETLQSEGIDKNTLVIFTSDNGPWIMHENTKTHRIHGDARFLVGSAYPFRDGKGSTWEGGVRVPGVFYWPGVIEAGRLESNPASTMDVLPTLFALAGQKTPNDRQLDGRDIRPLLNPKQFKGNVDPFEFVYTGSADNRVYAYRSGPWKIHHALYSQTGKDYGFQASPEKPLLFNVELDPSERVDVSLEHPEILEKMQKDFQKKKAQLQAERPFWDQQ